MTTTATSPRRGSSCSASSSAACTLRRRDDRLASGSETTARLSAAIQDLCRLRSEWRQRTTIKTFWAYMRDEATDDLKQLVSKHADREDPMFRKHPETFLVSEADRLAYEHLSKQLSAKKKSKRSTALNDDDDEERPMKRNKRSSDDLEAKKIQRQTAETRPAGNDQQRALCSLISLYRDTLLMHEQGRTSPPPATITRANANHRFAVPLFKIGSTLQLHRHQPTTLSTRSNLIRSHS